MSSASLNPARNEAPDDNAATQTGEPTGEMERARARLDAALGRLEGALAARAAAHVDARALAQAELAEKTSEIRRLEADNRELRDARDKVSTRLDNAIGRLEGVLAN